MNLIQPPQLETVKACFDDPSTDCHFSKNPLLPITVFEALENVNSPKVVLNKNMNALISAVLSFRTNVCGEASG